MQAETMQIDLNNQLENSNFSTTQKIWLKCWKLFYSLL